MYGVKLTPVSHQEHERVVLIEPVPDVSRLWTYVHPDDVETRHLIPTRRSACVTEQVQ